MIKVKSKKEIQKMLEGGQKLKKVKSKLKDAVGEGVTAGKIEELANKLIEKQGGKASFKMVDGYSWATCINVNEGVVHGIPHPDITFAEGDVVSVDVGMYYKGYHTDTSFTVGIETPGEINKFLDLGKEALNKAIKSAKVDNRVYDISKQMQNVVEGGGFNVIRALVGHGIGKKLHEDPQIPCYVSGKRDRYEKISEGAVFAIEVMYTFGNPQVKVASDDWTIVTSDGKISALFEETVAVTKNGPKVLTD